MRTYVFILILVSVIIACNNSGRGITDKDEKESHLIIDKIVATTSTDTTTTQGKLKVLVLPPYDEIANAGISPNIREYLEKEISKDTSITLIEFPFRQLMHVPYQNVYDKKYCKPIIENVMPDIIVMSKLDYVTRTGQMNTDKWNFQIKIYNTNIDSQYVSIVTARNVNASGIEKYIANKQNDLMKEIKNNR